ncbi:MAG: hypothetical protein AAFR42_17230 [Cyanobacteria bacterium J06628_6]
MKGLNVTGQPDDAANVGRLQNQPQQQSPHLLPLNQKHRPSQTIPRPQLHRVPMGRLMMTKLLITISQPAQRLLKILIARMLNLLATPQLNSNRDQHRIVHLAPFLLRAVQLLPKRVLRPHPSRPPHDQVLRQTKQPPNPDLNRVLSRDLNRLPSQPLSLGPSQPRNPGPNRRLPSQGPNRLLSQGLNRLLSQHLRLHLLLANNQPKASA